MSNDLRKHMNILEAPGGIGDAIRGAFGDTKAKGRNDAKRASTKLAKEYDEWLGKANLEPTNKSLMQFLVSRVKFIIHNARIILDDSGIKDPTKTDDIQELSPNEVNKALSNAVSFAYENDLIADKDGEEKTTKGKGTTSSPTTGSRATRARYDASPESDIDKIRKTADKDKDVGASKSKFFDELSRNGLSSEYVSDMDDLLKDVKNYADLTKKFDGMERKQMQDQLAKIGFAFIKSRQ